MTGDLRRPTPGKGRATAAYPRLQRKHWESRPPETLSLRAQGTRSVQLNSTGLSHEAQPDGPIGREGLGTMGRMGNRSTSLGDSAGAIKTGRKARSVKVKARTSESLAATCKPRRPAQLGTEPAWRAHALTRPASLSMTRLWESFGGLLRVCSRTGLQPA